MRDHQPDLAERVDRATRSIWVAMARDPATVKRLLAAGGGETWTEVRSRPGFQPWTDDYATVLPLIEWPE